MTAPATRVPEGSPPGGIAPTVRRLRDGTIVRIRPATIDDRPGVVEFLRHLSRDSLELRFFTAVPTEVVLAEILSGPPSSDRLSLLMETVDRDPGRIVAHAEFVRSPPGGAKAEVAFLVADDRQGQGAGTLLLWELARAARTVGVHTLEAVVLTENQAMRDVFTGAGFPHILHFEGTEATVALDIARDPQTALCPVDLAPHRPPAAA